MDITQINDVKELKALAFDEIVKLEMAQNNLRLLQSRIAELSEAQPAEPTKEK